MRNRNSRWTEVDGHWPNNHIPTVSPAFQVCYLTLGMRDFFRKIMKIIKENYTVLSRYHLLDEKLSLKDKGLLTCLLSGTCCDGEILDINKLFSITNNNDSFKSILESLFNLIDAGYIEEIDGLYVVMEKPRSLDGSKL